MKKPRIPATGKLGLAAMLVVLLASSCVKEAEVPSSFPDRIAFGLFWPAEACVGSEACVELFELTSGALREDAADGQPGPEAPYSGDFSVVRDKEKYEQVEAFFKANPVPKEFLDYPSGYMGTPPQWSQRLYFEYEKDGVIRHWVIDGTFSTVPGHLQPYVSTISQMTSMASMN